MLYLGILAALGLTWYAFNQGSKFKSQIDPVINDLELVHSQLKKFGTSALTLDQLTDLSEKLEKTEFFGQRWGEFTETLVKTQEPEGLRIYNTHRPKEVLSLEQLCESHIDLTWFHSFPSVLTGLGLCGTFIFIALGLNNLSVGQNEVTGIAEFINGLSAKFICSIVGLVLAITFSSFEKKRSAKLNKLILNIEHSLDRMFPQKVTEKILENTLREIQSQGRLLKDFSDEFGPSLSKGLNENIAPIMARLKEGIEELVKLTTEMRNEKNESTKSLVREIVSEFNSALKEHAETEFDNLSRSIQGTADAASVVAERVNQVIAHSEHSLETQNERITQLQDSFTKMAEDLEENGRKFVREMADIASSAIKANGNWLEEVKKGFSESLTEQLETSKTANADLTATFEKSLQDGYSSFNKKIDSTGDALEGVLTRLNLWTSETANELDKFSSVLKSEISNVEKTSGIMSEATSNLGSTFERQENSLEKIASLSVSFDSILNKVSDSSDRLVVVHTESKEFVDRIRENLEQSTRIRDDVDRIMQRHGELYSSLDKAVGSSLSALNEAAAKHSDSIEQSVQKNTNEYDRHFSTATKHLKESIDELKEQLLILSNGIEFTPKNSSHIKEPELITVES